MNKENKILCLDALGLLGIAGYCVLSSIFGSDFAEISINFSFLDFPVFISEQLLFVLAILFSVKTFLTKKIQPWNWIWIVYVGWILILSLSEYKHYGPLTLRNAALFYYVIFALFGYSFYNSSIFSNQIVIKAAFLLSLSMVVLKLGNVYFWYSYMVLILVIILKNFYNHRWWLIPAVFLLAHYELLFLGKRAHMVGIFGALVFLAIIVLAHWLKISRTVKLIAFVIFITLFIFGFHRFGDQNAIKSILDWKEIQELYAQNRQYIESHKKDYKEQLIVCKLYNKNSAVQEEQASTENTIQNNSSGGFSDQAVKNQNALLMKADNKQPDVAASARTPENQDSKSLVKAGNEKLPVQGAAGRADRNNTGSFLDQSEDSNQFVEVRNLDVAQSNTLFRIFIWQDMWNELYPHKLITGVGFGHPQRSSSIEILNWATGEWSRDGWIMSHNSFYHMFYRAGFIGLLVVFGLLGTIVYLTRFFIQRKDISGILLVSILVYWCLIAIFSVTLELPYYAILFWSLLGTVFAYALKKKDSKLV